MERRRFNTLLGAAGLSAAAAEADQPERNAEPEVLHLTPNAWIPNNSRLPILLYKGAMAVEGADPASLVENVFQKNGWPPQWRDGVYDFHHYHSTAHEVLGFARGHARLLLGGPNAHEVIVHAGDVALLPAGTGHCKLEASADFLVVGAYPPGQHWDICRNTLSKEALERMLALPFPTTDPVRGSGGPLTAQWQRAMA